MNAGPQTPVLVGWSTRVLGRLDVWQTWHIVILCSLTIPCNMVPKIHIVSAPYPALIGPWPCLLGSAGRSIVGTKRKFMEQLTNTQTERQKKAILSA